jgi:IS5 family transposase
MGWFYGFKLHLVVNHKGCTVAAKITPAKTHDTKPVSGMVVDSMNKLYADKGYISKTFANELLEHGVTLVNNVRNNMKKKVLSLWDRAMLSRRFIIETINDQLKNIQQIEHSRHRSVHGFMLNMIGGLIEYQLKEESHNLI